MTLAAMVVVRKPYRAGLPPADASGEASRPAAQPHPSVTLPTVSKVEDLPADDLTPARCKVCERDKNGHRFGHRRSL